APAPALVPNGDKKISELPLRAVVTGTEEFPLIAAGVNYRASVGSVVELADTTTTHTTSDPPASPKPGDLWFENDSGNTFVRYADVNGEQWVQIVGSLPGSGGGNDFRQSGPAAVTRSVTDRLRDTVHLLDFIPPEEHEDIH